MRPPSAKDRLRARAATRLARACCRSRSYGRDRSRPATVLRRRAFDVSARPWDARTDYDGAAGHDPDEGTRSNVLGERGANALRRCGQLGARIDHVLIERQIATGVAEQLLGDAVVARLAGSALRPSAVPSTATGGRLRSASAATARSTANTWPSAGTMFLRIAAVTRFRTSCEPCPARTRLLDGVGVPVHFAQIVVEQRRVESAGEHGVGDSQQRPRGSVRDDRHGFDELHRRLNASGRRHRDV